MSVKTLLLELKNDRRLRFLKWAWILLIFTMITVVAIMVFMTTRVAPSFGELENPQVKQASEIFDANGDVFGVYYVENRIPVDFKDINPSIADALIATEDERYYDHCGIDIIALSRVLVKTLILRKEDSGGGSTISQQLAKLLFERPSTKGKSTVHKTLSIIQSKLKEWIIAVKLERSYTKGEILAMYLNKFEFINGAHGIQAAAKIYFNKTQDKLNVGEAATLVGMLKNPSLYNPVRFHDRAMARRNLVLSLLENKNGVLLDSIKSKPIDLSQFKKDEQSNGPAPYFRAELTKWIQQLIIDQKLKKSDGTYYNLYTDGLKIHTTIDLKYQAYAEEASREHMAHLQEKYFKKWKNQDPWTFEADSLQKIIRHESLISKLKSCDEYLELRAKTLSPILSKIPSHLKTSDNIIETLIKSDTNAVILRELVEKGYVEQSEVNEYKQLKNNTLYTELKQAYNKLQHLFMEVAQKPKKMVIYDYANNGEKEVDMSLIDSVRYSTMHLQNAVLAIDPSNGHVKAWVGGINHKHFKYDHVTSRRSVGSTMKPFVYTAAMAFGGMQPCQEFEDIQYTIAPGDANFNVDKEWTPKNATEVFTGNMYNLYQGLVYSKNSITVRLVKEMGSVDMIRDLLDKVGISKIERLAGGRLAVPETPAICLGAVDINLLQMTGAYTTFANKGGYRTPIFVTHIEDKNGREIYRAEELVRPAINPLYNAIMVDMLKHVVGGEFSMGLKSENGGKTGTTNDFSDGWFMGITPSLVVGVWTGGDDKWIRFTNLDDGQGYTTARPVFKKFFQKLEADATGIYNSTLTFAAPPEGFTEMVDCKKIKTQRPASERKQLQKEKMKRDEFEAEF